MILPSIDLMNGNAVQLVGGREKAIDAGDPLPLAEQFRIAGEIAVIDLDAAIGTGNNTAVIEQLLQAAPCRIGGGIRDVDTAIRWLDAGAAKIIIGTAATPELLRQLPPKRVVVALDAIDGEVVTHGWRTRSGETIEQRLADLRGLADEFMITFVEREGRMIGIDIDRVQALVDAAGDATITIAGGVRDVDDIAALDRLGANVQIGMALYTGAITLADAITAPMKTDRSDGRWPTVVVDERGTPLGLAYSSPASVREAVETQSGVYDSRSRNALWRKGDTSGATQQLLRIDLDCDRDTLRFTVQQQPPGFCHNNTRTCWGNASGLTDLEQRLEDRRSHAPLGSYTARLFNDDALLDAKIREEAAEFIAAGDREHITAEAADLLYFMLTRLRQHDIPLSDVERELDRRALRVTRRPGNAKPQFSTEAGSQS